MSAAPRLQAPVAPGSYGAIDRVGTSHITGGGAHAGTAQVRRPLPRGATPQRAEQPAVCEATSVATSGSPLAELTAFAGTSHDLQVAQPWSAGMQDLAPPDTQVAAGPTQIVEMVNASVRVTDRSGGQLAFGSLYSLFQVAGGWTFSDPRVLFDTQSQRWFASGFIYDAGYNSKVLLAVSTSADATGAWSVYVAFSTTTGIVTDQPKIATGSDKVVVAWDDGTSQAVYAEEVLVVEKADVVSGVQSPRMYDSGPHTDRLHALPVQMLAPSTTQYLVVNALENPTVAPAIEVESVTGLPSAHSVLITTGSAPIRDSVEPPPAAQPGYPGTPVLDTGDRRFLNGFWANGVIWATSDDGCTTDGSTVSAGMRAIAVSTAATTPSVVEDFDAGVPNGSLLYPALIPDPAGNMALVATFTSPTASPGVVAGAVHASTPSVVSPLITVLPGAAPYNDASSPSRWGDYSGVAVDAVNAHDLWLAGERSGGSGRSAWATEIAEVSFSFPVPPPFLAGVVGSDRGLYVLNNAAQGFSPRGGELTAAPAIVWVPAAGGGGAYAYVVTGTDRQLWTRTDSSGWQLLSNAYTACLDNPAAVVSGAPGSTVLTVACQGTDHQLYASAAVVRPGVPPSLGGFGPLGGVLTAGPAAAVVGGVVTYVVTGLDQHVYVRTASSGYVQQQWLCRGHPAAGSAGSTAWFACHGTDDGLWFASNGGGGWSSTHTAGGVIVDGPGVAPLPNNQAAFFAEGTDGALWEILGSPGGTISGWSSNGGSVQFGASAI